MTEEDPLLELRCHACPRRLIKRYKPGRSIRMHALTVHYRSGDGVVAAEQRQHRKQKDQKSRDRAAEDIFASSFTHDAVAYTKECLKAERLKEPFIGRRKRKRAALGEDNLNKEPSKAKRTKSEAWVSFARLGAIGGLKHLLACNQWRWLDRDEHGSTAEHYAAGAGQLDALKFCLRLRFATCERHRILLDTSAFNDDNASMSCPSSSLPKPSREVLESPTWSTTKCTCERALNRRQDGRSALHWAARNGHLITLRFLVQMCGADVEVGTFDGTTPLMYAVFGAQEDAACALVQLGADPKRTNDWDCDIAHWIAISRCKNIDAVKRVCTWIKQHAGVGFGRAQKEGRTPLHKAAFINNTGLVDWLLLEEDPGELKQMLKAKDNAGQTPESLAKLEGHTALAERLKALMELTDDIKNE